jgi:hypothetical protein
MTLPRNWRLELNNRSGVNVDVLVKARRWKFDASGVLTYEASETTVFNTSAIASSTTAWSNGAAQDNSGTGDRWLGAIFEVSITPASSATLDVLLRMQHSVDAGATWPSAGNGQGLLACSTPAAVSGVQRFSVRFPT